ncbi:CHRD domain-containing protein [Nonomuraea angiospora]|uniref:CHRD domain-containing protein n=1 Tax=Nonomuraea angiospora TaxID=46172 RepID=UPI0029B15F10|nr:CHRD domain-containing protein [Nonomuraea angiospora]MDX3105472.1 CHRD domain-containing protein [Nonomuraea angiospora]
MNTSEQLGNRRIQWRRAVAGAAIAALASTAALAVTSAPANAAPATFTSAKTYYFAAVLLGRNEVPEAGKKVNDRNGLAAAKFRIKGDRLYYFVQWKKVAKPTAFHIHRGKAGKNGPVVIDLLSNGTIRGNTSSGSVRVKDTSVLNGIKKNPKNWYANLHTSEFPDGAVRAQLHGAHHW